jgi:hypothetical protein
MSTYRKYSFTTEAEYNKAIKALVIKPIDGVEQPQIEFTAIPRTCLITPAVIEDGKVVTDAVIDPNYNVDILWNEEEPKKFVKYQVWPKGVGQYIIGGWEGAYEADRKKALGIVEPELNILK